RRPPGQGCGGDGVPAEPRHVSVGSTVAAATRGDDSVNRRVDPLARSSGRWVAGCLALALGACSGKQSSTDAGAGGAAAGRGGNAGGAGAVGTGGRAGGAAGAGAAGSAGGASPGGAGGGG